MPQEATQRRAQLGVELRKARVAARMTQAQAAAKLGCRQGKINKIETTQCAISPRDVVMLLSIYDPPETDKVAIRALAADTAVMPASSRSRVYLQLRALEPEAVEILALHSERVPRPLQSERYTRMQLVRAGALTTMAGLLRERQDRVRLFTVERQPRYRVILSESSLYRVPGGREPRLVADQAQHLLDLCAAHEHISVRILTYDADIPFLESDFTVLKFAGSQSDIVYVEFAAEGRILRPAKAVAERERYWHEVHDAALGPGESKSFLQELVERERHLTAHT